MADPIRALVAHCRADTTLVTLVGASGRIDMYIDPESSLSALAIVSADTSGPVTPATQQLTIEFYAKAASNKRSTVVSITDRLRTLFATMNNTSIGSGSNTAFVVLSEEGNTDLPRQEATGKPWMAKATYNMLFAL